MLLGRTQDAIERLSRIIAARPDAARAYLMRGEAYLHAADRAALALRDFDDAIARNGSLVAARLRRAQLGLRLKRYDAVAQDLRIAMRLEESPALYAAQGALLYAQNNWPAAEHSLQRALELDANHAEAHAYLGMIYQQRGQVCARSATGAACGHADAAARGRRRQIPRALDAFQHALRHDGNIGCAVAGLHRHVARVFHALGRPDDAIRHYRFHAAARDAARRAHA